MKCLQNPVSGEVRRVDNTEASKLASYGWRYISKTGFKAKVVENAKLKAPLKLGKWEGGKHV